MTTSTESVLNAAAIWEAYPSFQRSPEIPALFRHGDLVAFLDELTAEAGDLFDLDVIHQSAEGRDIHHLRFGEGATPVLIWARQHGDEPLCSAALMDFLGFLADNRDSPVVRTISDSLTLHIVPMVNPDGVERFTRRNAMSIDPNRDARLRATPAGQTLRMVWEEYRPRFCFNLHDQSPRKSTSDTGELIALSLQACPFDERESGGPHLNRAKSMAGHIANVLDPWIGGHIARYEAEYMVRAFGDSMSRWGVSSILIESGGWFGSAQHSTDFITRCHFLALLTGVHAAAVSADAEVPPSRYDNLPLEGRPHFDLLVRQPLIVSGHELMPMRGDIGINRNIDHRADDTLQGRIRDLGDMTIFRGRTEIQGRDLIATPALVAFDPTLTPELMSDEARVQGYLRRGITTVVGLWEGEGQAHVIEPTQRRMLRGVFFESVPDLQTAAERDHLTEAHGFAVRLPAVQTESLRALVPTLAVEEESVSAHLLMVNAGRPSQNLGLALIGPSEGSEAVVLDTDPLRSAYHEWNAAIAIGPEGFSGLLGEATNTLLLSANPAAPTLSQLVSDAGEAGRWHPVALIHSLTQKPARGLGLETLGSLAARQSADLLLWGWERGSADHPEEIRLGALRHVIVAGHELDVE